MHDEMPALETIDVTEGDIHAKSNEGVHSMPQEIQEPEGTPQGETRAEKLHSQGLAAVCTKGHIERSVITIPVWNEGGKYDRRLKKCVRCYGHITHFVTKNGTRLTVWR